MDITQNSIEQQRRQLVDDIQTLPADLLQEIADIISHLKKRTADSEIEKFSEQATSYPYRAFKDSGFIGCGEGPSDLSANYKEYLEEGWKEKYGYC
ncbi:MAG: hypothetical protein AAF716_17360 [Cyanobacteria bacterium P01_D01_bin.1]